MSAPFYVGQEVVTRRAKHGVVVAVGASTVDVRFGGSIFTMKHGQVVSARVYGRRGPGPTHHPSG